MSSRHLYTMKAKSYPAKRRADTSDFELTRTYVGPGRQAEKLGGVDDDPRVKTYNKTDVKLMADQYTDYSESKKKFLVPLAVLLLCGVALTGAAYAYSSNLDVAKDGDYHAYLINVDGGYVIQEDVSVKYDVTVDYSTDTPTYKLSLNTTESQFKFKVMLDTEHSVGTDAFQLKSVGITVAGVEGLTATSDCPPYVEGATGYTEKEITVTFAFADKSFETLGELQAFLGTLSEKVKLTIAIQSEAAPAPESP